mgnify:CR=1 FL=1
MKSASAAPQRAVVLLSGGLDSATVLAMAHERHFETYALSFDYGQRHHSELQAAASVAAALGAKEHRVVKLDLTAWGGSALTDTSIAVPTAPCASVSNIPITYVPARNTIFLSLALAWAETLNAPHIFAGMNAVDYSGYPDCRDDTVKALQAALNLGMAKNFELHTPLMWLDKASTWKLAHQLGGAGLVDLIREHSHTCYLGERGAQHDWGYGCGECPACIATATPGTTPPTVPRTARRSN